MAPPPKLEPLTLPEAYATASLFMLSLRETLWEAAADVSSQRGLWGPHGLCRAVCAQLDVPERAWETLERTAYLDLADTIPSLVDVLDAPAPGEEAAAAADEAARREAEAAARKAADAAGAALAAAREEAARAAAAAARASPSWHPLAEPAPPPAAAPAPEPSAPPPPPPAAAAPPSFRPLPPMRPEDCFSLFDDEDESAHGTPPKPGGSAPRVLRGSPLRPAPRPPAPPDAHVAMEPLLLSTASLVVGDTSAEAGCSGGGAAASGASEACVDPLGATAAAAAAAPLPPPPVAAAAPAPAAAPAFDDPLRALAAEAEAKTATKAAAAASDPLALLPPGAAALLAPAGAAEAERPYEFANGANGHRSTEGFGTAPISVMFPDKHTHQQQHRRHAAPRPPPPRRRARRADVALRELLKVLAGRCDGEEMYDARARVGLRRTARHLRLTKADVTALEMEVAMALPQISLWPNLGTDANCGAEDADGDGKAGGEASSGQQQDAGAAAAGAMNAVATVDADESYASARNYKVAAAAAAGAGLLALTGGIAAPAILAGAAALLPGVTAVGGAGGFIAGAAITGGFSVAGGKIAAQSMSNRTAPLTEFRFAPVPFAEDTMGSGGRGLPRLAVTMCVSGWLQDEADFTRPWEPLSSLDAERIAVCWETKVLLKLGNALKALMSDAGVMELVKGGAMHTALHGVLSAVALPAAFLTATSMIDNVWARALDRSDQAAALLAAALMDGAWYLRRPVTLLGYSLGARVVFGAMQRLAAAGCVGIVESVVLFGAPVTADPCEWDAVRQATACRLVNVYTENDWMLALVYRASSLATGVAGLRPVPAEGVENINVSHLVRGHTFYPAALPTLLGVISAAPPPRRA